MNKQDLSLVPSGELINELIDRVPIFENCLKHLVDMMSHEDFYKNGVGEVHYPKIEDDNVASEV